MSNNDSTPPFKSSLPELKLPEDGWKSNLPPHLLEGADEQTKWIMNEISRNSAATEFACKAVVDTNAHLRTLNGRTFKNEKNLAEAQTQIESLNGQAKAVSPFLKPLIMFATLWEYRGFRWVFYAAIFFFFTYLLPYYLAHPFDLSTVFNHFLGS